MLAKTKIIKKEMDDIGIYLPFLRHLNESMVMLENGHMMAVLKLDGISFETIDIADINALNNQLNVIWRNIASDQLSVMHHLVRREEKSYPDGDFTSAFASKLNGTYRQSIINTKLFVNDLYLTLVWRPRDALKQKASAFMAKIRKSKKEGIEVDEAEIKSFEETIRNLLSFLQHYNPRILRLYARRSSTSEEGILFSEPSEFLRQILTATLEPVPLVRGKIGRAIHTDRIVFGHAAFEIKKVDHSLFGGTLAFREYMPTTYPGLINSILSAPFPFVCSQGFSFLGKPEARGKMVRKQTVMISSQERAYSQISELDDALDDLESNRFVMGEHHFSLTIYGKSLPEVENNLAEGRRRLADAGAVVAREDLGLEAAFWAQFPDNRKFRTRPAPITSRNFADLASFHTYPAGRKDNNHWGQAVALLKTASGSPYYFNFHVHDLGNTFICGPSGSGKTVAQNFLLAQLEKFNPQRIFFDKDRGAEIFIRACGGTYLTLRNGKATGLAPLKALELTSANLAFLRSFIRKLVSGPGRNLSVAEEKRIDSALDGLQHIPQAQRSLLALRQQLGQQDPEGIGARLEKWCHGKTLGWVFDNPADQVSLNQKLMGFDMTEFLDNAEIRTPLMMYLFHRVEQLIDGRRIVIDIDEFWKALGDEAFRDLAQNKLKTFRKQNGLLIFGTQSPADALKSEISHTIIEQCPTQIFFPNPKASEHDYCEGFKLTRREYYLIKEEIIPETRRFLIKQGNYSVVAELNLGGMWDELAVLSGTTKNVELLDQIRERVGDDPAQWLPVFLNERKKA